MPLQFQGAGGNTVKESGTAFAGWVTTPKPIDYGTLGHYRVNHRCAIINAQAAASRLFEIRNSSAVNLIIPTHLIIKCLQTGAHTVALETSIDVFKVTGFSVLDTTNTVTLTPSVKRTLGMTVAASTGAQFRGVTIAGAAAGMTGGTLTKDASAVGQLPVWLLAAMPTTGNVFPQVSDYFDDVNGTHPFVLAQNEGIIVENRVLLGAAAGSSVYIDFSYVEVSTY